MIDANDTLIQSAPEGTTAALRMIDERIAGLQTAAQAILQDHIACEGWSTVTHDILFDLKTGVFTITPKLKEAA